MGNTKTKGNIGELRKEVELLRSFVIGVAGKDKEGEYRPEFVRKILEAAGKKPNHIFTAPSYFLRKLRQ